MRLLFLDMALGMLKPLLFFFDFDILPLSDPNSSGKYYPGPGLSIDVYFLTSNAIEITALGILLSSASFG